MNELKNKSKFLKDVWYLTKSYWQSEEGRTGNRPSGLLRRSRSCSCGLCGMAPDNSLCQKWNSPSPASMALSGSHRTDEGTGFPESRGYL